jgi:hypothetical protein
MIPQFIVIFAALFFWCGMGHADIILKRYSTSTYSNTNAVDLVSGKLGIQSEPDVGHISVLRVGFRQYANPFINIASRLSLANKLSLLHESTGMVYGQILFHPNPMRLREGARLQYVLNKPSSITIQIYDMFGHRVFTRFLIEGGEGARAGTNHLTFDASVFNYYDVSAGLYLMYIFDDRNRLIGRTKFAIVP